LADEFAAFQGIPLPFNLPQPPLKVLRHLNVNDVMWLLKTAYVVRGGICLRCIAHFSSPLIAIRIAAAPF
jgi:hypothetical protein